MSRRFEWIVPVALLMLTACPGKVIDLGNDAGPDVIGPQICSSDNECPGYNPDLAVQTVRCEGVCTYLCNGIQDECNTAPNGTARFCDAQGVCSVGCRPGSVCPNAGELCVAGVCQTGASQCATRCDCDPGEVCNGGVCQQPSGGPCATGDDCPRGPKSPVDNCNAVACNGVSDTCFELSPQPCAATADCVGRFGCTGSVSCSCNNTACVPSTSCTAQNEATTCGTGNFCDATNLCQALPACTQPGDCSGLGLTCNAKTASCERAQACTTSADCPVAPNTHCPTGGGFCTIPTCANGGPGCGAGLECNAAQGRCVTPGTGVVCQGDSQCPTSAFCDLNASECRTGCRNNASCPSGQDCDGNRQCVTTGAGGGFGAACSTPGECRSPLTCGLLSGTCAENCADASQCVSCNAANGNCRCNGFGFCTP